MLGLNLPISSLKRDEIYIFIGGLYISVSWLLYFMIPEYNNVKIEGISLFILTAIFLLCWLTSCIILYIVLLILKSLLEKIIKCRTKKFKLINYKNFLEIYTNPPYYITLSRVEELISLNLINRIILATIILSVFPINKLLCKIIACNQYVFCGSFLVLIYVLCKKLFLIGTTQISIDALSLVMTTEN